jgi:hypothetical protein
MTLGYPFYRQDYAASWGVGAERLSTPVRARRDEGADLSKATPITCRKQAAYMIEDELMFIGLR